MGPRADGGRTPSRARLVEKTREFSPQLGLPGRLGELGIGDEMFIEMAERVVARKTIRGFKPLDRQDVFNIYKAAL